MDFKVTGTREGICGVQMDIKGRWPQHGYHAQSPGTGPQRQALHILDAMPHFVLKPRVPM